MTVLTYLACPYSHPDHSVRVERFIAANRAAGYLIREGHTVFSPISHTHPIAEEGELPKGWTFWRSFDTAYLSVSRAFIVLAIDGWEESVGVAAEHEIAARFGLSPVYMVSSGEAYRFVNSREAVAKLWTKMTAETMRSILDYVDAPVPDRTPVGTVYQLGERPLPEPK